MPEQELGEARSKDCRLLLIDMTPVDGSAATSTLKQAYFADWPAQSFLHLFLPGAGQLGLQYGPSRALGRVDTFPCRDLALDDACRRFSPDVILYRPVADHLYLHDAALRLIDTLGKPFALWLMDDWPERLRNTDLAAHERMDADLRRLFACSYANFAISDSMAETFRKRYGVEFDIVRNGVRQADWPQRVRGKHSSRTPIKLRYSGNLAPDMTRASVLETARAVTKLREEGIDIVFEGRTQPHWMRVADELLADLDGVTFSTAGMPMERYRRWLTNADILLLAYNFDEETRRYVQYSFANKAPELLAAGSAIIAYGPDYIDTIEYLAKRGLAQMVTKQGVAEITEGLRVLIRDPNLRLTLGRRGAAHAFQAFELNKQKRMMTAKLQEISERWRPPIFELHPKVRADFDELAFAVKALDANGRGGHISCLGEPALNRATQFSNAGWIVTTISPSDDARRAGEVITGDTAILCIDITQPSSVGVVRNSIETRKPDIVYAINKRATNDIETMRRDEIAASLATKGYCVFLSGWRIPEDSETEPFWTKLARYPGEALEGAAGAIIAFLEEPPAETLATAFSSALRYSKQYDPRTGSPLKKSVQPTRARPASARRANGTEAMSIKSYIIARHPVLADILRFTVWSVRAMGRRLFGFTGLFLVLMAVLGAAAWRMPEQAAWWILIGAASVIGFIAFLAIGYAKYRFSIYKNELTATLVELRFAQREATNSARAAHEKLIAEQEALRVEEQAALRVELQKEDRALAEALTRTKKALREEQLHKITHLQQKFARLAHKEEELRTDTNKLIAASLHMSVANASAVRPHVRRLEDATLERFLRTWVKTFGLDLSKSQLAYLAHKICLMEDLADGRLATPIETMLLRLLASHSLKGDTLDFLEIGTLFGVSAGGLYALRAPQERKVSLTLIDPMEGYYGRSVRDPITGVPIVEDVLRRNMARLEIPDEAWRLIKHLSTDEAAIEEAGKKAYDMVIIDGDHSIEGVARDYELYGTMVKPGGILIFDDYDNPDWPGIKPFVDEYVKPDSKWNWIGGEYFTGIFRRTVV